jgi:hypothetical protein
MGSFDQSNSSQLLEKLKRNEPVVAMMIRGSRTSDVARIAASTGYQSIIVDLEHSTMALDVVAEMVTSANDYGVLPFVRVPERDYESVGRILDAGACGIVLLGSKRRNKVLKSRVLSDLLCAGNVPRMGLSTNRKNRVLRVPATTFIITHSPSRSNHGDGFGFPEECDG